MHTYTDITFNYTYIYTNIIYKTDMQIDLHNSNNK